MNPKPIIADERFVLRKFADYLKRGSGCNLWYKLNYSLGNRKLPISQPKIDLIYGPIVNGSRYTPISAAEIKYIRVTKDRGITHSYYAGLDEALALLRYGVDYALLIHLIDIKLLEQSILSYPKTLHILIRNLKLPIGYRVYAVNTIHDVKFYTTLLRPQIDLKGLWIGAPQNPLLSENFETCGLVNKFRKRIINNLKLRSH